MALVSENSREVTATPARASLTGVEPDRPRPPRRYTRTLATNAPPKANQMYPYTEEIPSTPTDRTTAKAAPALTPRMPGSANGLRVSACISAPDRPRAAPVARPRAVRGRRTD